MASPPDRFPQIVIPPSWAPFGHRVVLRLLRASPLGQSQGFKIHEVLTRLTKRHRRAQTYFGAIIDCDVSDFIPMCIFHFGVWEPHISGLIQSRLRPGDMFCDVGANIGYDSLLAAKIVGRSGRVVAIEPSPSIFEKLVNNIRLNDISHVRVVRAAVSAESCIIPLYSGGDAHNSGKTTTVMSRGSAKECDVDGRTLADILACDERDRLRLIKIDVEGAERPILTSLLDSIDLYPSNLEILVELSTPTNRDESAAISNIFSRFSGQGFRAYSVPNSYDIAETYINFRDVQLPTPITLPLTVQQDVLFSRSYLPS